MKPKTRFLFIVATAFLLPLFIKAQDQTKLERAISGAMGYKDRGDRYEGFYNSLVSATDLQIVQFTKGPLKYSAEHPESIMLAVPATETQAVNVRGMGIPRNLYYQMDLTLKPGTKYSWGTGEVLLKDSRTKYSRLLGLLGFTESGGTRTYVPIEVNEPEANAYYMIKLVSSSLIREVTWKLKGYSEFKELRNGGEYPAGRDITIYLPKELPAGTYNLEIYGYESDGVTPVAKSFKIRL